ncbi:MAG TPA: PEP-CTERM sorting domain-containing protein [Pirellulales bacterium]|nr:PEP-CTERM sorting domain-containing protein [Pirellulales bacterium]
MRHHLTMRRRASLGAIIVGTAIVAFAASTKSSLAAVIYNNDNPNSSMAAASRPATPGRVEIEAADDFLLTQTTRIDSATFTGLIPLEAPLGSITGVAVEIYRVFPLDSTNPPDGNVPTRTNSPSDNALTGRDSTVAGELTFTPTLVAASFTASNSVLNGINKSPNQTTSGEGAVSGEEVQFSLTFPGGITLPADHYFFKPEVALSNGDFFWLSATRPFSGTGSFTPDLQAWIRNSSLDPDWLRIGTDIVGGTTPPTFNMSFSLSGTVVPEPASIVPLLIGAGAMAIIYFRRFTRGQD